jgi:hypothetical protein
MSAKHTPGPWELDDENAVCAGGVYIAAVKQVPCVAIRSIDLVTWDANARLIAAAPDLLDACRAMVAWDAAENSAEPFDNDNGTGFYQRIALCREAFDKARAAIAKATGEQQ